MVKLMRPLLLLGSMILAKGADEAACAVDGAKSMSHLADAAIFSWAATKRCGKAGHSQAECVVDIAEATESVNEVINVIVAAANECGAIHTEHVKCGMAVGELTAASAGLAAAVAGILTSCPVGAGSHGSVGLGERTELGKCIIDAKASMLGLFSASHKLSAVGSHGAAHGIDVVAALADLGESLAASVAHCSAYNGAGNADAACAAHALGLVSALHHVAHAGVEIGHGCREDSARLYLEASHETASSSSMLLALAALIPISAVFSFVAGRRFAKRSQAAQEVDVESVELLQE